MAKARFPKEYALGIAGVAAALGLLVYLGVAYPGSIRPDRCVLQFGLNCKHHVVDVAANTITLTLQNEMGEGIIIHDILVFGPRLSGCYMNSSWQPYSGIFLEKQGLHIRNDDEREAVVHCDAIYPAEGKLMAKIEMKWSTPGSHDIFVHTLAGELFTAWKRGDDYCCCSLRKDGISYDSWVRKQLCIEHGNSCLAENFHSCSMVQQSCCVKGNETKYPMYFWGMVNCSEHPGWVADDSYCEY